MNESKISNIKTAIAKIDIGKIADYLGNNPNSKTLRQIIRYSKRVLDSNEEEEIFKLAVSLAYNLDTIVNKSKYVKDEAERQFWLGISEELFENTVGVKDNKSYIKHDEIKHLSSTNETDKWIDKYLEAYHDDEPNHIKWRLNALRLLWKKRKELNK